MRARAQSDGAARRSNMMRWPVGTRRVRCLPLEPREAAVELDRAADIREPDGARANEPDRGSDTATVTCPRSARATSWDAGCELPIVPTASPCPIAAPCASRALGTHVSSPSSRALSSRGLVATHMCGTMVDIRVDVMIVEPPSMHRIIAATQTVIERGEGLRPQSGFPAMARRGRGPRRAGSCRSRRCSGRLRRGLPRAGTGA